jgi:hypothetical protein
MNEVKNTMGGGEGLSADIAIVGQELNPGRVSIAAVKEGLDDLGLEYGCLKVDGGYLAIASDGQQAVATEVLKSEKAALAAALLHFTESKSAVT